MFKTARDLRQKHAYCVSHLRNCEVNVIESDCKVAGLPCSPHTPQRAGSSQKPAQQHEEFEVLHEYVKSIVQSGCHGGIVEEVPGFLKPLKPHEVKLDSRVTKMPKSWCHYLVKVLQQMGYSVKVIRLSNATWINVLRVRLECFIE